MAKELNLSYVLPVRNEQCSLANCLRSLLNQNIPGDIIVIDDASTDMTPEIIEYFRDRIEATGGQIITYKRNQGAAKCRNKGNKLAKGDIILVCDAEYYPKERSEAVHELFVKHDDIGVFYSGYSIRPANNLYEVYQIGLLPWDFESKCTISHPTVAYRKEVALKYRYHKESKATDLFEFMLLDMHRDGIKFGPCNADLMRKIEGNTNRDMTESKKLKLMKYKNYGIDIDEENF